MEKIMNIERLRSMYARRQCEYECICGYIWIDSKNNGCPMCGKTTGIITKPYEIKQPKEFSKK